MPVTIHVGKNTYFLTSIGMPAEEDEEEEATPDPQSADWQELAGPGGVAPPPAMLMQGGGPMVARRRRPIGVSAPPRRRVIQGTGPLLEAVRADVSLLTPGGGAPGPQVYGGLSSPLDKCREKVEIDRLDEGFVVTVYRPVPKKRIESAVVSASKPDASAEKISSRVNVMELVMEGIDQIGLATGRSTGPTKIYGFSSVDGVVEFVRKTVSRDKK